MEIFGFGSIFFAHCFCSAGLFFRAVLLFSLAQSFVPASPFCVPCSRRAGLSPPLAFLSLFSFISFVAGHFWAVLLFSLAQSFVLAYPFCVPCSCRAGLSPPLAFLFLFPFFFIAPCSRRDGHFILASSFLFLFPFSIFRTPLLFGYPIFVLTPLPFFAVLYSFCPPFRGIHSDEWSLPRKVRNKQTHALNGNICRKGIGTINVSSLHTQNQGLEDLRGSVFLLQETRITDIAKAAMRSILRHRGWNVLWGHGVPSAHTAGVAIISKPGISVSSIPPSTSAGQAAYEAGRLMLAAVALGGGRNVIYIVNVYAHSGAEHMHKREELFEAVFQETAALGNVSIAVGGDWNCSPDSSGTLQDAFATGQWYDVGALAGKAHVPTYIGHRAQSRLD